MFFPYSLSTTDIEIHQLRHICSYFGITFIIIFLSAAFFGFHFDFPNKVNEFGILLRSNKNEKVHLIAIKKKKLNYIEDCAWSEK